MAAAILLVGAAIGIVNGLLSGSRFLIVGLSSAGVDMLLAIGLYQFGRRVRTLALIRAILGGIVWSVFYFGSYDPASAVLASLAQWGYAGALMLLLAGHGETWRLILAGMLFVVLTLGIASLGWLSVA